MLNSFTFQVVIALLLSVALLRALTLRLRHTNALRSASLLRVRAD
jgi:hypothetical protein